MVNDDGRVEQCTHSGWGYIGAPMAAHTHNVCVEAWKRQGFYPVPDVGLGLRLESGTTRVNFVIPNSGAQRAGIKVGDVLRSVAGQAVQRPGEFYRLLAMKQAGDLIDVLLELNGQRVELRVVVEKQRSNPD